MELSDIAGVALQMSQSKGRDELGMIMIKQAADNQKQLANMLESQTLKLQPNPSYKLSVYA
jgi:hypothetical protein